jgi:hypothetical protein
LSNFAAFCISVFCAPLQNGRYGLQITNYFHSVGIGALFSHVPCHHSENDGYIDGYFVGLHAEAVKTSCAGGHACSMPSFGE